MRNQPVRIFICGLGNGPSTEFDGKWLAEYDPHRCGHDSKGRHMIAHLKVVDDPAKALTFSDTIEAFKFWRQEDGARPDGKPNRPLTAFTVEFTKLKSHA